MLFIKIYIIFSLLMTYLLSQYAKFPAPLKDKIMAQMWNYNNTNLAILETSHRSPIFAKVNDDAILNIRKYLGVPDNYKVLLMQGGEQLTQASIPFNLLKTNKKCTYLVSGPRSQFASTQAKIHPDVVVNIFNKESKLVLKSDFDTREVNDSTYTYVCVQDWQSGNFIAEPNPLANQITVLDCTSILGLYPIDIKRHGIVFGAIEYSLGLPGVCIAIVRQDLVGKEMKQCPNMMSYATMDEKKSIYNTPNCFAVYTLGEHIKHLVQQGGLQETHKRTQKVSDYVEQLGNKSEGAVKIDRNGSKLIINIQIKEASTNVHERLDEKKLLKTDGKQVVVKIQSSTTQKDVDLLFEELRKA